MVSPGGGPLITCTVELQGSTFLAAASARGIEPEADAGCHLISVANNKFYAMPGSPCVLRFPNSTWLVAGAEFRSVRGRGDFTAERSGGGLKVTIAKGGGFYLEHVSVKAGGPFASCNALKPADVLR